jgi:hypothetical protein
MDSKRKQYCAIYKVNPLKYDKLIRIPFFSLSLIIGFKEGKFD